MRKMNRRFRGKNKTTDVLSFPALEPSQVSKSRPGPPAEIPLQGEGKNSGQEELAGDLAISVERAQRQAADHGHALAMEIKILILHGLLHLSGYDHERDAGEMARRERLLRGRLGLPQGLIERAAHAGTKGPRDQGTKKARRVAAAGAKR